MRQLRKKEIRAKKVRKLYSKEQCEKGPIVGGIVSEKDNSDKFKIL
jgi:hypothetical protein